MRNVLNVLLSILLLMVATACGGNKVDGSDMSIEQKLQILTAKITKHDKDHTLYYERAGLLLQMGRANEAIADMVKATQLKEDNPEYFLRLADAYFANGDMEHSYSSLDKVLILNPSSQEAVLKQGEIAYYSRDYDRALENLSKVTKKDPNNRIALTMKAFVYKEKGDTVNAVTLLRKVCDLYPDHSQAFEELGMLYSQVHNPLAVDYLSTAIRLDTTNTNAMYNLAMYYQENNMADEAANIYNQMLQRSPYDKYALHNLGYLELFYYEDYARAIDYFSQALRADSLYVEARVNRGCAYELSGDRANALCDFVLAKEQRPTFQPALDGLKRLGR